MTLESGARIGPYEVGEEIGSGGMGVVFRATDTNLKRDVAIKVLPESLAADQERLARFQREAEVLASLNHPNIAQIHGLEKSGGTTVLIMELVEGETLDQHMRRGPVPVDESLNIATQIAEAMESAHDRGIVHRDLKPANIKLTPNGTVKVLDFGIAKALDVRAVSGGLSPVMTTPAMTETGVILGTAAYMSPEQARGKGVDERTDIWAFGCLLYEMLTGQPAFGGEDVTVTLARILEREPDMDAIPAAVAPSVAQTIELCLEKDVRRRIADIRDVRLALEGAFETRASSTAQASAAATPLSSRALPLAAAALAGSAAVGLAALALWPAPDAPRVTRFVLTDSPGRSLSIQGFNRDVVFLPDGSGLIYRALEEGRPALVRRPLDSLDGTLLDSVLTFDVFVSPDGSWVGYIDETGIKRIPVSGGPAVFLASLDGAFPRGSAWAPNDTIIYGTSGPSGLWRIPAGGGMPELLTTRDDTNERLNHAWPHVLPGGEAMLFTIQRLDESADSSEIALLNLATGEQRVLISGGSDGRYLPTGHIVYGFDGTLRAVPFDLDRLEVTDNAVPVLDGVGTTGVGAANFSVSENGTLAYVAGTQAGGTRSLVWVDRNGREEAIDITPSAYIYPRISPDGTRVALDDRNDANDIWVWDFDRETRTRLTVGPGGGYYPTWNQDGTRIAYQSVSPDGTGGGMYWKNANNTGSPEPFAAGSGGTSPSPLFFTPDGRVVFRSTESLGGSIDIGMIAAGADAEPVWLLDEPYAERNAELSPDGRWIAYESNEASGPGSWEIYVRPFPNVDDDVWPISNAGGEHPLWSRDGTALELFYIEPGPPERLMSVSVRTTDAEVRLGEPTRVIDWPYLWTAPAYGRPYDVSPDSQRFLALRIGIAEDATPRIVIVENWLEELARVAPAE